MGDCLYGGLHHRKIGIVGMAQELHHGEAGEQSEQTHIQMPAPTFWPMVFAFGVTLLFAGLVTQWVVSAVGS